ncbi:Hypothetical predicted protein, partial [Marmota monax]
MKEVDECHQRSYKVAAEEEEVSSSQVDNVDGEDIPVYAEAREPDNNCISCQPNHGIDE